MGNIKISGKIADINWERETYVSSPSQIADAISRMQKEVYDEFERKGILERPKNWEELKNQLAEKFGIKLDE